MSFDLPQTPGYNVAYVGNISFDVDDAAIAAFFEGCGVSKVRLHTDKETGRSKGYAHVHFEDEEGLDRCGGGHWGWWGLASHRLNRAVARNGKELAGRQVRVSFAQQKKAAA